MEAQFKSFDRYKVKAENDDGNINDWKYKFSFAEHRNHMILKRVFKYQLWDSYPSKLCGIHFRTFVIEKRKKNLKFGLCDLKFINLF